MSVSTSTAEMHRPAKSAGMAAGTRPDAHQDVSLPNLGVIYAPLTSTHAICISNAAAFAVAQPVGCDLGGPVVSVIDDDAAVRKALSRLLRLHGFVPHLFASAEEFLESDDLQATSCIISDMRMPGMSGVELGALLRDRGSDTPIIYMTAYREERERASAMQAVFLIKPFDPQQLLASVRAAIDHAPDAEPTLQ